MTSSVYFIHGGTWNVVPNKRTSANAAMRNHLELDYGQDIVEGALVCRIQRKHAESGEFIQDESKSIHLLVAWRADHTKELDIRALLVEHDKEFNWAEDKLRRLYQKYWHSLKAWFNPIIGNWLLDDATVLTMTIIVTNGGYGRDIFIYEEMTNSYAMRPYWIDAEGWVSMMLAIFLILTCTASLTLNETLDVTIRSQYSDIELASPVYFCDGRTYNEYSIERTDVGTMMRIGFRYDIGESGGIVMYEVQRNRNTKSDHQPSTDTTSTETVGDASKIMRLLVTWKTDYSHGSGAHIILVEHDNKLVLSEAELAQLYDRIYDLPIEVYNWTHKYGSICKSTWSMNDNTVLGAAYEIVFEKGRELKITISEGIKDEYTKSALWIDSER
jgi:hypothetical protein